MFDSENVRFHMKSHCPKQALWIEIILLTGEYMTLMILIYGKYLASRARFKHKSKSLNYYSLLLYYALIFGN